MSDPHHDSGYTGGLVDAGAKTASKLIDAIASPVLIFLIVINVIVVGAVLYTWHSQRVGALGAYSHLVDACLPGKEKN